MSAPFRQATIRRSHPLRRRQVGSTVRHDGFGREPIALIASARNALLYRGPPPEQRRTVFQARLSAFQYLAATSVRARVTAAPGHCRNRKPATRLPTRAIDCLRVPPTFVRRSGRPPEQMLAEREDNQ